MKRWIRELSPSVFFSRYALLLGLLWLVGGVCVGVRYALDSDDVAHLKFARESSYFEHLFAQWWPHHPPAYFLMLKFWRTFSHSEVWLRTLNQILVLLCLYTGYRFVERYEGKARGWVLVLFLATSSMLFILGLDLRGYALAFTASFLALYFYESWIRNPQSRFVLAGAGFSLLSFLSEYGAVILLPFLVLWVAIRAYGKKIGSNQAKIFGVVHSICFLIATSCYYRSIRLQAKVVNEDYLRSFVRGPQEVLGVWEFGWQRLLESLSGFFFGTVSPGVGGLLLYILLVVVALRRFRGADRAAWFVLFAGPVLFSAALGAVGIYPAGYTRHSVFLLLPMSLALAFSFSALLRKLESYPRGQVVVFTLSIFLFVGYLPLLKRTLVEPEQAIRTRISDVRRVSALLGQAACEGKTLLLPNRQFVILDYYPLTRPMDSDCSEVHSVAVWSVVSFGFEPYSLCKSLEQLLQVNFGASPIAVGYTYSARFPPKEGWFWDATDGLITKGFIARPTVIGFGQVFEILMEPEHLASFRAWCQATAPDFEMRTEELVLSKFPLERFESSL